MRRAAVLLVLAACADPAMEIAEMPCPATGTALTYENFGAAFLADHCNRCHADSSSGAPRTYRFDSVEDVRIHADRIFIRAAGPNVTMPPGPDDPPGDQRDELAEWLACGAP